MGIITDKISKNKYKGSIAEASLNQYEVAYYIESDEQCPYISIFNKRVKTIYNNDEYKFNRFNKGFKGKVLPSVELCQTIFNDLFRVFDSENQNIQRNFKDDKIKDTALSIISKTHEWYKTELWEAQKTQFNSIVIVDLPIIQSGEYPEPYPIIIDISDVKYISFNKDKEISEIIFVEKKDKLKFYHYYSDAFYIVCNEQEEITQESSHDLGYCPAKFIRNRYLRGSDLVLRDGLLMSVREHLFWFVFKTIESRKADLLYLNPDKQMPKNSCGYDVENQKCSGGKLVDKNKQPLLSSDGKSHLLCPVCGETQFNSGGAGNSILIDLNSMAVKEGKVDPSKEFVKYITPSTEGVEIQYKRINELYEHITKAVCGVEQVKTREAINELQIQASFENKEIILKNLSHDLSETISWIEKTQLKLIAGNKFLSNTYDLGTIFYLYTVDDLYLRREKASNTLEKSSIDEQIIDIKYHNNQDKKEREKLLYKILPYNTISDTEFYELLDKGIFDEDLKYIRINFLMLINKLENEYGNILNLYQESNAKNKIEQIKDILLTYKEKQDVQN